MHYFRELTINVCYSVADWEEQALADELRPPVPFVRALRCGHCRPFHSKKSHEVVRTVIEFKRGDSFSIDKIDGTQLQ